MMYLATPDTVVTSNVLLVVVEHIDGPGGRHQPHKPAHVSGERPELPEIEPAGKHTLVSAHLTHSHTHSHTRTHSLTHTHKPAHVSGERPELPEIEPAGKHTLISAHFTHSHTHTHLTHSHTQTSACERRAARAPGDWACGKTHSH